MPNSENNDSGGIRSQMESDKQTKQDLEESLREIGTAIEELSRKVEESKPTVVAEEVRQKADHLETKAEKINTALIELQSKGVPLENEKKIEEMSRKLQRFMDVVGPAKSLAEVRTELSREWETKIEDLKEAWALALKEIRDDKKYRKTVTDDLKTSWWHVTKIVIASSLGGMMLIALTISGLTWLGVPILPEEVRMTPEERELIEDGRAAKAAFQGLEGEEFERLQDLWRQGIENSQAQGQE
jgi:nitrogen fixation protein